MGLRYGLDAKIANVKARYACGKHLVTGCMVPAGCRRLTKFKAGTWPRRSSAVPFLMSGTKGLVVVRGPNDGVLVLALAKYVHQWLRFSNALHMGGSSLGGFRSSFPFGSL